MHQDHNIPWSIFEAHYRASSYECENCLIQECSRVPFHRCPTIVLESRNLPNQSSQLLHWMKCFIRTIREFSKTERAKYPSDISWPPDKALLHSKFASEYAVSRSLPENLDMLLLHDMDPAVTLAALPLEKWPAQLDQRPWAGRHLPPANLVKILLDDDKPLELLKLARTGMIGGNAYDCGQSHQQGWRAATELALQAYIALNVIGAVPGLQPAHEKGMRWNYVRAFASKAFQPKDHDCQRWAHWKEWLEFADGDPVRMWVGNWNPFKNKEVLEKYLKKCFRILYLSAMVAAESGFDIIWGEMIGAELRFALDLKWKPIDSKISFE